MCVRDPVSPGELGDGFVELHEISIRPLIRDFVLLRFFHPSLWKAKVMAGTKFKELRMIGELVLFILL